MLNLQFSGLEVAALLDALKKGAARHESYAKFYRRSRQIEHHQIMAGRMRDLIRDVERAVARERRQSA